MSNSRIRLLIAAALASFLLLTVPSFADSQARIVRLSDVQGDVQIDRNTGQGYEKAFLNLPLTQGVKIKTGEKARAEVEFEDGSALRITPDTAIEFPQLSLRDSGAKVSTMDLQKGTAYVNFAGGKNDEFTVSFGHEKLMFSRPARLRIQMGDTEASVAVFKGEAQVVTASGPMNVGKNETITFDLARPNRETLAKEVEPGPYDSWDKQQDQYQDRYASSSSSSYSPYAYGVSDLNYYGGFFNLAGYGTLWQPYFIGAGWDPFLNGAWAFYPGFGYGWVSGYPWGWTPYHYGSWVFLPGRGWAWQPGGSWSAANTLPRVQNPPAKFALPHPPNSGQGTIFVNRGAMPNQNGSFNNKVEIRENSAGLGIPRGSIRNLGELSPLVQQQGSASARLHTAPIGGSSWWRGEYSEPDSRMGMWHGSSGTSSSAGHTSGGHSSGGSHH